MKIIKKYVIAAILMVSILVSAMPVYADKLGAKGSSTTEESSESNEETLAESSEAEPVAKEESAAEPQDESVETPAEESSEEVVEDVAEEAQPETFEIENAPYEAIVQLISGYLMDDGTMDAWIYGTGVMFNDSIITSYSAVSFTGAEDERYIALVNSRASAYQTLRGIDLHDYFTASSAMKTYAVFSDGTKMSVSVYKYENGSYAILKGGIEGKASAIFADGCLDQKAAVLGFTDTQLMETSSNIASGNPMSAMETSMEVVDVVSMYIPAGLNVGYNGSPVIDVNGSVIGIVLDTEGSLLGADEITALVPEEEEIILPDEIKATDKELMNAKEMLQQALISVQGIIRESYTAESLSELDSIVEYATLLYSSDDVDATELMATATRVREATASLVVAKSSPSVSGYVTVIILLVLAVGLSGGIISLFLKRKVMVPLKQDVEKKKAKKKKKGNTLNNLLGIRNLDYNEEEKAMGYGGLLVMNALETDKNAAIKREAGETTVNDIGSAETTVLSPMAALEITLTRKSNNSVIEISKPEFVLGKELHKVDYCLSGNPTISRRHCALRWDGNDVCVEDLGSLNGTFVNDVKCVPSKFFKVKDGDTIRMSDEEFTYHQKLK